MNKILAPLKYYFLTSKPIDHKGPHPDEVDEKPHKTPHKNFYSRKKNINNFRFNLIHQALSGDFQYACGKMHM